MKKILAAIIVTVLIGVGVFLVINNRTTDQSTTTTPATTESPSTQSTPKESIAVEDTKTVTYDGSSFSPSILTVKPGTTVNFKNNSSGPMWVASDPHPVHTDFSAFDAMKSYGEGQTAQTGRFECSAY